MKFFYVGTGWSLWTVDLTEFGYEAPQPYYDDPLQLLRDGRRELSEQFALLMGWPT